MKEILLLKAEVAGDVEEGSAFQHVNFFNFLFFAEGHVFSNILAW